MHAGGTDLLVFLPCSQNGIGIPHLYQRQVCLYLHREWGVKELRWVTDVHACRRHRFDFFFCPTTGCNRHTGEARATRSKRDQGSGCSASVVGPGPTKPLHATHTHAHTRTTPRLVKSQDKSTQRQRTRVLYSPWKGGKGLPPFHGGRSEDTDRGGDGSHSDSESDRGWRS